MEIKGKIALVTGAATGIGLGYVTELLRNGAQVSPLYFTSKLASPLSRFTHPFIHTPSL